MAEPIGNSKCQAGHNGQSALGGFPPWALHRAVVMPMQAFSGGCVPLMMGMVMTASMIVIMMVGVISNGNDRLSRTIPLRKLSKRITETGNTLFDGAKIDAVIVADRHRARGNRYRNILDAGHAAYSRVDLGGAAGAVHTADLVSRLIYCRHRAGSLPFVSDHLSCLQPLATRAARGKTPTRAFLLQCISTWILRVHNY